MRGYNRDSKRVLLVEGETDREFIKGLMELFEGERFSDVLIDAKRGAPSVLKSIAAEIRVDGRISLGIILDANGNPLDRWTQVVQELKLGCKDSGLVGIARKLPHQPDLNGTIVESTPRIGVWIMPDNNRNGQIEDFITDMIRPDKSLQLSREFIQSIPVDIRQFSDNRVPKAVFWAWLSTRKNPGVIRRSISVDNLDLCNPVAQRFIDWLGRMFA